LFVLPELEDLEGCLREDYSFGTDIFAIPSENSHLELMLRVGQLIKDHESPDTLFLVYYGGHARIDESRQSTWCATRDADSSWLQWSAIQTLLERSKSDVLILLDCCAGAASATFPTGNSITETISASSWDAIAPDPGRYSFTNALIEVLQEWRMRAFSAAMLHAEVLARLKHPRPININGKHFEARSTPVHFMMTSNHKAPSIELCRTPPDEKLSSPAPDVNLSVDVHEAAQATTDVSEVVPDGLISKEPNEDTPHVMISLALEEDQRLDINAWEQWISAFPAMAKYVKVQGVFKSHSTLLLVSMPVMIWDLLPEDPATSFVAFIRSNNLANQPRQLPPGQVPVHVPNAQREAAGPDMASIVTGTTFAGTVSTVASSGFQGMNVDSRGSTNMMRHPYSAAQLQTPVPRNEPPPMSTSPVNMPARRIRAVGSHASLGTLQRNQTSSSAESSNTISRQAILNQQQSQRRTTLGHDVPEPKRFAPHIEKRLEEYYQSESLPSDAQRAFFASNLGIDTFHLEVWFHHRRERDMVSNRLATMKMYDVPREGGIGARMIMPADLSQLLEMSLPTQVLLFDLRPPAEYQKSHIFGASNLRAPRTFLEAASLEMVERVFADGQDRATFSAWRNARCVVFYSKGLEFPWECPAADLLLDKLCSSGWHGQCFVLKGHYREFSATFDKFVAGPKMTQEADDWIRTRRAKLSMPANPAQSQEQYAALLSRLETEDRLRPVTASPTRTAERTRSVELHEKELEAEFQARHASLYGKALEVRGKRPLVNSIAEAQMVEHLDRGLAKMRGAQAARAVPEPSAAAQYDPGYSKLAAEAGGYSDRAYLDRDVADEYVEITRNDGSDARAAARMAGDARPVGEDVVRRGRGGNLLTKVFRRS
jgi:hypothetical protein